MKALITGASSGIGKEMAYYLAELGYDLILVARRKDLIREIAPKVKTKVKVIPLDLSEFDNIELLWNSIEKEDIDIFINNAGFGLYGKFIESDLDRELNMIDLNIKALHYLSKKYIESRLEKNTGYLLNVASSAGFMAGPKMATYYATKNYVLRLSQAIYEELRHDNYNIHVSVLCPGPVETEFNQVAKCKFGVKGANAKYVAKYAIDKMLKNKLVIIPTLKMKLAILGSRFVPTKLLLKINYKVQSAKEN